MTYAASQVLQEAGYPESVVARVVALRARLDEYYRGSLNSEEARQLVDGVRAEPWFDLAFLPDPAKQGSVRWRHEMDVDIRSSLRQLRLPILLIFGEHDRWVPIGPSLAAWRASVGAKVRLTTATIPGAGHFPTLPADPGDWSESGPISLDYERVLLAWLRQERVASVDT
jgi:pimeloyl-ACP methyl ester carboxylesterase